MLGEMIFLASYGSFDQIFSQLEAAGTFTYVLPFLFIFALVFGILSRAKIFENNKGINVIISLVVALMALQTDFVANFFSIVSPLIGAGLVVLLVVLIFGGLVGVKEGWFAYVVFGIGAVILLNILLDTAKALNSPWWDFWVEWKGMLIFITVLMIIILSVIGATSGKETDYGKIAGKLLKGITD